MRFSGVSANAIWNNAVRTLTGLGTGFAVLNTAAQTIAASATVDLRPAVNHAREITVAVKTGGTATGSISIQITDGVSPFLVVATAAAANATAAFSIVGGPTEGPRLLNNDAAVAGTYLFSGFDWAN